MIKWFKSLSSQEKLMAFLIVILFVGVVLRWENIRDKALVWFQYDDIMEERAKQDSLKAIRQELPADSVSVETVVSDTLK